MRLSWQWGRSVSQILEELTPEEFEELRAGYYLLGLNGWQQAATVAAASHNAACDLISSWGGQGEKLKKLPKDFRPRLRKLAKEKPADDRQVAHWFAREAKKYGGNR